MYMGLAACRPWPCGLRPCLRLACRRVAVPSFALALPRSRDCRLGMIRNPHRKAMPTTRIRVHPLSAFGLYRIDCPRARAAPGSAAPPPRLPSPVRAASALGARVSSRLTRVQLYLGKGNTAVYTAVGARHIRHGCHTRLLLVLGTYVMHPSPRAPCAAESCTMRLYTAV